MFMNVFLAKLNFKQNLFLFFSTFRLNCFFIFAFGCGFKYFDYSNKFIYFYVSYCVTFSQRVLLFVLVFSLLYIVNIVSKVTPARFFLCPNKYTLFDWTDFLCHRNQEQ